MILKITETSFYWSITIRQPQKDEKTKKRFNQLNNYLWSSTRDQTDGEPIDKGDQHLQIYRHRYNETPNDAEEEKYEQLEDKDTASAWFNAELKNLQGYKESTNMRKLLMI